MSNIVNKWQLKSAETSVRNNCDYLCQDREKSLVIVKQFSGLFLILNCYSDKHKTLNLTHLDLNNNTDDGVIVKLETF